MMKESVQDKHSPSPPPSQPLAGPGRRLGALLYDSMLLFGVLFIASALALVLTGGEAVPAGQPLFSGYLLGVCFVFYGWFWTHGGQTLGMRAWKIRLQRHDGGSLGWGQALVRFLLASLWLLPLAYLRQVLQLGLIPSVAVSLGFFLLLLMVRFHDRYSETVLVRIRPEKR